MEKDGRDHSLRFFFKGRGGPTKMNLKTDGRDGRPSLYLIVEGCGSLAFSLRERCVRPLPSAQCPDPNAQPLRKLSDQCGSIQRAIESPREHTQQLERPGGIQRAFRKHSEGVPCKWSLSALLLRALCVLSVL